VAETARKNRTFLEPTRFRFLRPSVHSEELEASQERRIMQGGREGGKRAQKGKIPININTLSSNNIDSFSENQYTTLNAR